jgi:hypothetical protein
MVPHLGERPMPAWVDEKSRLADFYGPLFPLFPGLVSLYEMVQLAARRPVQRRVGPSGRLKKSSPVEFSYQRGVTKDWQAGDCS